MVTLGSHHRRITGTGSDAWNGVIAKVGRRVRAAENPHQTDYRASNYPGQKIRTFSHSVAKILVEEMERAGIGE
jgi:hypothetical protein